MPLDNIDNPFVVATDNVPDPAEDRYAIAVRQVLRQSLVNLWSDGAPHPTHGYTQSQHAIESIEVMPDERPKPNCGPVFFAISGSTRIVPGDQYEEHFVDVEVAITLRNLATPKDRLGLHKNVASKYASVDRKRVVSWIAQAVVASLSDRINVPQASNDETDYTGERLLLSALRLKEITKSRIVTGRHFSSPNEDTGGTPETGLLKFVRFTDGYQFRTRP